MTEIAIMRLMDIILTLPSLLLAIVIVAILGPGLMNAMLAVAVVVLPHYVRITRAAVISETSKDYVTAARAERRQPAAADVQRGAAQLRGTADRAGVARCLHSDPRRRGAGLPRPGRAAAASEWGTMLADAREFVVRAWWVVTFPGLMILITVLAFNLLGDGLRDALDPKLKR